ncbi:hypothetical protein EV359DRAFT_81953 [Lentinula novae-zelandiae]|nr:hypothetical protein EV359DRAFT_81953 [Lentinula novae-zelandiae]
MRKHDLQSATRIFIRSRSNQAVLNHGNLNKSPPLNPRKPITLLEPTLRTAPYTSVPLSLVPAVVGVLAGPEAGGDPPFASVYPSSRHGRQMRVKSPYRGRETGGLEDTIPPSPQDLWTRALTIASKDVKSITSKMLVYFFERGKASYRPWSPNASSNYSNAGSNISGVGPDTHRDPPILDHTVRLTLSHYTTLINGLLLRRHYSVALSWVRRLIYPFPTFPTYTSSHFKHLPRVSNLPRYSRESVHLSLDGTALSACLLVLARLGRVHEAIAVLEAYAAPSIIPSTLGLTLSDRNTDARNVQLNAIQMNDFLLTLLRWPTKKHALPVPSADFPLPLKSVKAELSSATFDKSKNTRKLTGKDTFRTSSWIARTTDSTRSARPDLLLRILLALYPRYGVSWDSRTVCLMLQAVRMSAKMDGISAFGLRKVIKDIFAGSTKIKRKEMLDESLQLQSDLEQTRGPESVDRQSWLTENIMEVLWEPVGAEKLGLLPSSRSPLKLSITKASKKIKKKEIPLTHTPRRSSLRPLEYGPFTPWPVTASSPPPLPTLNSNIKTDTGSDTHFPYPTLTHPFLLAREIFLRLVWEHAASSNKNENTGIDLHALPSPAALPPSSFARLLDPDGDGLGHLGGLPKWFGLLEGALKRKFGFGSKLLTISSIMSLVSEKANARMKLVDEVFGYPEDPHSPMVPKLTPTAFHHYILMLGLSAPEPWEFVQTGWNQQYPFQGYPHSIGSTCISANAITRSTSPPSSGPFTSCTSTPQTTKGVAPALSSLSIPGPSEIPITLSYMRALRLVPTKDTLCAAVVFWREAVGGETLAELGVREYKMSSMERGDGEEEDAYTREYETWKVNVEPPESKNSLDCKGQGSGKITISEIGTMGEYAKFCRWIREWVDEINVGTGTGEKTTLTMPHPYHIHRWAGIVRKMREGQGYDSEDDNM